MAEVGSAGTAEITAIADEGALAEKPDRTAEICPMSYEDRTAEICSTSYDPVTGPGSVIETDAADFSGIFLEQPFLIDVQKAVGSEPVVAKKESRESDDDAFVHDRNLVTELSSGKDKNVDFVNGFEKAEIVEIEKQIPKKERLEYEDGAAENRNLESGDALLKKENIEFEDGLSKKGIESEDQFAQKKIVQSEDSPAKKKPVESAGGPLGLLKKKNAQGFAKKRNMASEFGPDGFTKKKKRRTEERRNARNKNVRALREQPRALSYDENLMDVLIQSQLGAELSPAKGKKKKALDLDKNREKEAMIAACIGFPKDSLTEEEIEAGVVQTIGDVEQDNYIEVRNHILARWRESVNAWLDQSQIMETIRSQHKLLVAAAYKFLMSYGYINFGVSPAVKAVIPAEPTKSTIVIVGAGLAGLAAARQLLAFGHRVAVVEGRNRPGGRVYTRKMEGGGQIAAADLGGSVITGLHGNPLGVLARQLFIPLHKIREKCPLYQPDGSPLAADVDAKVETQFNKLLDRASQLREQMGSIAEGISLGQTLETLREDAGVADVLGERQLFDWHLANLEYANAGLLSELSLAFWDQDDPYEMGGDHCFLPGGNVRLVSALAEGIPIFYGKQVHTIRYGSSGVQVITTNQVFEGDMALCTVPLGVLKQKMIKFEPELPQRKLDAIRRLGFGLLNKVAMLFPRVFWGSELDTFGHLAESSERRGEFFLFYSYAAVSGGPLLLALVAGEAAINFELMHPAEAIQRVLTILKGIYEPQGISVPDPIQTVCTRWGGDPLSFGSYSHVAVGASGDDYDLLAESVGDGRLFFAGEATNRRYPATMHGALLSGLREAGNISAHAANRLIPTKVERAILKDTQAYATLLADLFREPDLEFGSFAVLFDPRTSELKSHVLLRVMIGMGAKKKVNENGMYDQPPLSQRLLFQQFQMYHQQHLHLYTMISRQQALELMEVRGGDKARLVFLCETLGVKLVGRRGLGGQGDSLVSAIKWGRTARKPVISPSILNGGANVKLPKPQVIPEESLQSR